MTGRLLSDYTIERRAPAASFNLWMCLRLTPCDPGGSVSKCGSMLAAIQTSGSWLRIGRHAPPLMGSGAHH